MLEPYDKPHLSFQEQVDLLKQRGLGISDEPLARTHLERIGYYRLKPYWHPLRQSVTHQPLTPGQKPRIEVLEIFRPGAELKHAVELYIFDKKLRLLFLDALERIEVALRVDISHTLGLRGAFAHRDAVQLDPRNAVRPSSIDPSLTRHDEWLGNADRQEARARADWVQQFRAEYAPPLPVWMAVELWDFGTLSHLLDLMHPTDRAKIGRKYGVANPKTFGSWARTLSYVRNICAHHDRLWNQPLVNQPAVPVGQDAVDVQHIGLHNLAQTRCYAAAAIAQHMLAVISPSSTWKDRLKTHWTGFPAVPGVIPSQGGFLQNWTNRAIWA